MYKILAYINPHVLKFIVLNKNLLINTLNIYITLLFAFTELIYLGKISSHIEDIWG
jgi:predicted phosphatase